MRSAGELGLALANCICDPWDLAALGHMTNCPARIEQMIYTTVMKVTTIHGFTENLEGEERPPCDCTVVLTGGGGKVELTVNDWEAAGAFAIALDSERTVTVTLDP